MTAQEACAIATVPEPYRVLGLRLQPYSLGHEIALSRIGSPYLSAAPCAVEDLCVAVFVCSRRWSELLTLLSGPGFQQHAHAWLASVFRRSWRTLFRRPSVNIAEKHTLFASYIRDGRMLPKMFLDDRQSSPMHAPLWQVVKVTLMRELHIAERELMERPFALTMWDYCTLIEMRGHGTFFDEEQHARDVEAAEEFHKRWMERQRQ